MSAKYWIDNDPKTFFYAESEGEAFDIAEAMGGKYLHSDDAGADFLPGEYFAYWDSGAGGFWQPIRDFRYEHWD